MSQAVTAVERFRKAMLEGDEDALAATLAENVFWAIGGECPLSGSYAGRDSVVSLFRVMRELSEGTLRPAGPNTYDVLESEYHCALIDRWLAERDDRSLDSHEAWIIHLSDGLVSDGFHYFSDQRAFEAFWS